MDAIILTAVLRTLLTVTTVWNNVETGDINRSETSMTIIAHQRKIS